MSVKIICNFSKLQNKEYFQVLICFKGSIIHFKNGIIQIKVNEINETVLI